MEVNSSIVYLKTLHSIINQENPCQYKCTFTDSFHWTHLSQYSEEKKQYYQDTFARQLYLCYNRSQCRYAIIRLINECWWKDHTVCLTCVNVRLLEPVNNVPSRYVHGTRSTQTNVLGRSLPDCRGVLLLHQRLPVLMDQHWNTCPCLARNSSEGTSFLKRNITTNFSAPSENTPQ